MNIYEKLQTARVELQGMSLKKSGYNKFAEFDYFELGDFMPQVNRIFEKLKLFSKFDLLEEKAILTIVDIEKEENTLIFESSKANAEVRAANSIQQLGATHTYLKRYLYLNALEIVENDPINAIIDKDKASKTETNNKNNKNSKSEHKKESSPKKEPTADEKRNRGLKYINDHAEKYKKIIDKALLSNSVNDIEKLTNEQVSELANSIRDLEKAAKKGA